MPSPFLFLLTLVPHREGTPVLHLDLWETCWSFKGLLTCLLQEAPLNT